LSPVVAVMDEDGDDLFLLQQALEQCRQDVRIQAFKNSEDLIEFLNRTKHSNGQNGEAADLIILGLHLPWESTFELIVKIKSDPALRQVPIIILIGLIPDSLIDKFYDAGANTLISRPVLWDELVKVLKKTCDYWFGPLKM